MVEDRLSDGRRIAELLASEIEGREDAPIDELEIRDADQSITPTADGARAYTIAAGETELATVFVHPERTRVELRVGTTAALETATEQGLRTRALESPPRLYVFVPDGVAVKRVMAVLARAIEAES